MNEQDKQTKNRQIKNKYFFTPFNQDCQRSIGVYSAHAHILQTRFVEEEKFPENWALEYFSN
jgi:hypothetical protein